MTPPVRGWAKVVVAGALVVSGTAVAALAGFAAGALWLAAGLPPPTTTAAVVVVVLALLADGAYALWGRPRPLAVGRQVPSVWSRFFSPVAVALLYGSRLGLGPLTILPTWLWWAAFGLGVAAGPWVAALGGAAFGLVRGGSMVVAAQWLAPAAADRMGRLRQWEARVAVATAPVVLAGVLLT